MKQKKIIIAAVLITCSLFLATAVLAQKGWKGGDRWYDAQPGPGMPYFHVPDLTDEQKAKMTDLRTQFLNDTAPLRGRLVTKRTELRAIQGNPESSPDEIATKQREALKIRTELAEKRIAHQAKMRGVLTKEQLKKMSEWGYGRGHGWGRGHKRGHHRGYGRGGGSGSGMGPGPGNPEGGGW
jgi:zinc resistance-associated protein